MALEELGIPYVPPWFFLSSNIRVLWIDLFESWMYVEIEAQCPKCGCTAKSTWVLTRDEDIILRDLKCRNCGYDIGEIVYRELESLLIELESLVERISSER